MCELASVMSICKLISFCNPLLVRNCTAHPMQFQGHVWFCFAFLHTGGILKDLFPLPVPRPKRSQLSLRYGLQVASNS